MRKLTLPDSGASQDGARRIAPSAERNLAPILAVLTRVLPPEGQAPEGQALEIASGTGQHIAAFSQAFPGLRWQPSDVNPDNLPSIRAWTEGLPAVAAPVLLDACRPGWGRAQAGKTSIHLTNLLHLIAMAEAEVLLSEVAQALAPGGLFCLYGPFRRDGALLSDGDKAFDASLRAQDPAIGYKDIAWVEAQLTAAGMVICERIEMPAGNLMVIARKA